MSGLRRSLANCSGEGVDEQILRVRIPENESVARESPGAQSNTGLSVEENSPLSERVARRAQRHDYVRVAGAVPVSDEQQVSTKQEPVWVGEINAREPLETQWE